MDDAPFRLRRATQADASFAVDVTRITMRDYALAAWGRWSDDEVRRVLDQHIAAGQCEIVERRQQAAGILVVQRPETHVQLESLFLLPPFQRLGLGTALVASLQDEARAVQLPLRLRVLRVNPAQRLYERLGFVLTSQTPERLYMEWRAD